MPKIKDKPKTRPAEQDKRTQADQADKYLLYGMSVQEPTNEVEFFAETYEKLNGRPPRLLREDFCGTHAVCCEWVKAHPDNLAYGIDLDPEPLAWGEDNLQAQLSAEQRKRLTLEEKDVRTGNTADAFVDAGGADVLAAQNFSFFLFKTRDALRDYFEHAHANLADGGIMVMDMMGGSECHIEDHEDIRTIEVEDKPLAKRLGYKKFKYIWEQARFNPISADALFHIHFRFKDGSRVDKAFTYDWRFWTLPETCELLREAGFSKVDVYWEGEGDDGEGDGVFSPATEGPADPSWIAYIVAQK
ncbi:MAG: class I SAM-dependent methyltransferase [Planctomycetota bacterium]